MLGAVVAGQAGPPSPAPFSLLLSNWPGLEPVRRQFSLPRRVLRVLQVDFFKYQRTYPSYDTILYFSPGVFENMGVSCLFICFCINSWPPTPMVPSATLDCELHSGKNSVVMPDAWDSARHNTDRLSIFPE